jgi:hypothetical protein
MPGASVLTVGRTDVALGSAPLVSLGVKEIVKNLLHCGAHLDGKARLHFSRVYGQNSLQFLAPLAR